MTLLIIYTLYILAMMALLACGIRQWKEYFQLFTNMLKSERLIATCFPIALVGKKIIMSLAVTVAYKSSQLQGFLICGSMLLYVVFMIVSMPFKRRISNWMTIIFEVIVIEIVLA